MAAMPRQPLGPAAEAAARHGGRLGAVGLARAGAPAGLLPATGLRPAALSLADAGGRRHGQRQECRSLGARRGGRARAVRAGGPLRSHGRGLAARFRAAWRFPPRPAARRPTCPWNRLPGDGDQPQAQYRGEYAGLSQSARYQVYLGDAWTDPLALSVTPLPVVEIEAEVVLPVYARQSADDVQKLPRGMRQFAVLAGSEVRLKLDSDRPLKAAEVKIAGRADLPDATRRCRGQRRGSLDAGHRRHAAGIRCRGTVVFDPGSRRGRPNPGAAAGRFHHHRARPAAGHHGQRRKTPIVLPTGSPNIHYEAADDHALGRIWLTWEATAGDVSAALPTRPRNARAGSRSAASRPKPSPRSQAADYPLALQSLPLKPGDTLKVTFHASDYRGPAAAATVDADPPLVFQVTDLRGFEASMYEADQKSAGALEDIRKKHSGLGETQ